MIKILIVNTFAHSSSSGTIAHTVYNCMKSKGCLVKLCCAGVRETKLQDVVCFCDQRTDFGAFLKPVVYSFILKSLFEKLGTIH